jgi:hypothetical protein
VNISADILACSRASKHPLAKAHSKVVTIALEQNNIKFDRLHKAMREAIRTGSWVIIENAHHVVEWPREILNLFYRIKDSLKFQEEQELWQDYRLNIQQKLYGKDENLADSIEIGGSGGKSKEALNPSRNEPGNEKLIIHKKFRLWIVTGLFSVFLYCYWKETFEQFLNQANTYHILYILLHGKYSINGIYLIHGIYSINGIYLIHGIYSIHENV